MSRAIGVFDSGVGGLTVLREVQRVLPQESTVYLGDNARIPYGGLPAETIRRYTLECLDYLYGLGAKALVIACNSATTAALEAAREAYPVPVVGVIEATARMVAASGRRRIGVVGTEATVAGGEYVRAMLDHGEQLEVFQQACPHLAAQVEAGEFATLRTEMLLEGYLRPLRERGIETLVLGCTHYGFVRPLIERFMGADVEVVECGPSVASTLVRLMERGELDGSSGEAPVRRLLTTGSAESFRRVATVLWPEGLPEIEEVTIGVEDGALRRQAA